MFVCKAEKWLDMSGRAPFKAEHYKTNNSLYYSVHSAFKQNNEVLLPLMYHAQCNVVGLRNPEHKSSQVLGHLRFHLHAVPQPLALRMPSMYVHDHIHSHPLISYTYMLHTQHTEWIVRYHRIPPPPQAGQTCRNTHIRTMVHTSLHTSVTHCRMYYAGGAFDNAMV